MLFAPTYYKKFKCLADKCTHSCCVGWEIDIDSDTAALYAALPGQFGDAVRSGIEKGESGACFALHPDGRCPNLDDRGLCRIISTLGDAYLCDICREHPRFYNVVGLRTECGVGASCEAAAALILNEDYAVIEPLDETPGTENGHTCGDFDAISARNALYAVLADRTVPYPARLDTVRARFAAYAGLNGVLPDTLEYLDANHKDLLEQSFGKEHVPTEKEAILCERFLAYLVYRHAAEAESVAEHRSCVGLALELERLFRSLIGQGIAPLKASASAAWLHGAAGDICAKELGQYGMLPSDMLSVIPRLMK